MPNRSERRAAERLLLPPQAAALPEFTPTADLAPIRISGRQFLANQANAQLSAGPTSELGKSIAARNHTSHGLTINLETHTGPFQVLPGENQAEFDAALALFTAEWKPATATERNFVERLTMHTWLARRAGRLIDQLLIAGNGSLRNEDLRQFEILSRYQTTHQRHCNRAFDDFLRLRNFQMRERKEQALLAQRAQAAAAKDQNGFESQKRKAEEHVIKIEILHLRLEAQKQRNQRTAKPQTNPAAPSDSKETPQIASA